MFFYIVEQLSSLRSIESGPFGNELELNVIEANYRRANFEKQVINVIFRHYAETPKIVLIFILIRIKNNFIITLIRVNLFG